MMVMRSLLQWRKLLPLGFILLAFYLLNFADLVNPVRAESSVEFPTVSASLQTGDKKPIQLLLEVAATPEQLARGLMFRHELPEHKGMIFLFTDGLGSGDIAPPSMWMKNTAIALDMIFLDRRGLMVGLAHAMPYSEDVITAPLTTQYVLEIKAGMAKKWQLQTGKTKLQFRYGKHQLN